MFAFVLCKSPYGISSGDVWRYIFRLLHLFYFGEEMRVFKANRVP